MVTGINNEKALCGCFGLYPSFVAGILNLTQQIHFFVLCNKQLDYENYIEKCISNKECGVSYKSDSGHSYQLSFQGESVFICFQQRLFPKLPSELIFAQSVLKNIQLDCLAYGIITVKGRVAFITNEVKSSMHACLNNAHFCEFDSQIKLANCKVYSQKSSLHPNNTCPYHTLFSSSKPFRVFAFTKCHCKLCVKDRSASL